MAAVHQCSLYSVFLEVTIVDHTDGSDHVLSCATGCLYRYSGQTYLVSNYHIFSGRNSETDVLMNEYKAVPHKVRVHFLLDAPGLPVEIREYPLTGADDIPLWHAHPAGGNVDIAVLPVEVPDHIAHFFVDEIVTQPGLTTDFFRVNQEVSVIGFPMAYRVDGRLPIWKRSVIASEPFSELSGNRRKVLIDTASRPGMSGSPVIFAGRNTSTWTPDGRELPLEIPSVRVLLGIYAGRISGDDTFAAQIGIVWSAKCLEEIVRNSFLAPAKLE